MQKIEIYETVKIHLTGGRRGCRVGEVREWLSPECSLLSHPCCYSSTIFSSVRPDCCLCDLCWLLSDQDCQDNSQALLPSHPVSLCVSTSYRLSTLRLSSSRGHCFVRTPRSLAAIRTVKWSEGRWCWLEGARLTLVTGYTPLSIANLPIIFQSRDKYLFKRWGEVRWGEVR